MGTCLNLFRRLSSTAAQVLRRWLRARPRRPATLNETSDRTTAQHIASMSTNGSPTPPPIQVSRLGITADSPFPSDLPFAAALRLLMEDRDYRSIRIGIDPASFYSEVPIELHDFVDEITYCFVVNEGAPFLAYEVHNRQGGVYREVAYDGQVLREWWIHEVLIGVPNELEVLRERSARMAVTLGRPT